MLRFGTVSETDGKGMARVNFAADSIVSNWLHIAVLKSLDDQHLHTYDVGEHVACLVDEHCETGVVLCAVYSKATEPHADLQSADVEGVVFKDGSKVTFNRASSEMVVDSRGKVIVTADTSISAKVGTTEVSLSTSKIKVKNAGASLGPILQNIANGLIVETHTTPLGPTTPPINLATYSAELAKIIALFDA